MTDATVPAPTTAPVPVTTGADQRPGPRRGARTARRVRPPHARWPRRERWAVTGLLALTSVPVLAGAVRLTELAGDPVVTEANARFVTAPVPVVVHIVTATVFSVLGAFQLMPTYRRRHLRRHRATGRVVAPAGVLAALSGLWMTVLYDPPAGDGVSLAVVRLVAGSAMAVFLVLGVVAVVRHDISRHRAWMIRGYALGLAAGTQVLTSAPLLMLDGPPGEPLRTTTMALGWVINAAVAEVLIRRRTVRRPAAISALPTMRP